MKHWIFFLRMKMMNHTEIINSEYLRKLLAWALPDIRPLFSSNAISATQAMKVRKDLLGNMEAGNQIINP